MHNAEVTSPHERGDDARWQTQQGLSSTTQLNELPEVPNPTAEQDDDARWHKRQRFVVKVFEALKAKLTSQLNEGTTRVGTKAEDLSSKYTPTAQVHERHYAEAPSSTVEQSNNAPAQTRWIRPQTEGFVAN